MSGFKPGRRPEGYNGTDTTSCDIRNLLPRLLGQIGAMHRERPDLILAAWPQVIGKKLASMTKAVSFDHAVLIVKVSNSTLYSLLAQHEKGRLLKSLREKFPAVVIKNIIFRMG